MTGAFSIRVEGNPWHAPATAIVLNAELAVRIRALLPQTAVVTVTGDLAEAFKELRHKYLAVDWRLFLDRPDMEREAPRMRTGFGLFAVPPPVGHQIWVDALSVLGEASGKITLAGVLGL